MNIKEYENVKAKYVVFTDEEFGAFMRQHAFEELDAQIECLYNNNPEEVGDGFVSGLTEAQVDEIVEDYIERFYDETGWKRDEMMRDAIQDVTGRIL